MLSLKKQNITKWIVFLPAFAILLTFSITLVIVITAERAEYQKSLDNTRIAYVKRSKAQAQERIDKLVEYINENEKFIMREARDEIKNIVNLSYQIINDIYTENPNLPREQILQKIKNKLRDTRFFSDLSGYYVVFGLDGTCVMHGANKELEGKNFLDEQDENGRFFIKEGIERLKAEEAFSLVYPWKNPRDTNVRTKIGYVRQFSPLNIYVASGRYEDEVRERIKKETQKLLLNTKYGEYGYIFAYDYDGYTISHGDHSLVGKNRLDVVINGHSVIKDIVEGGKRNLEGFFMTYVASYHPTAEDRSKISFIRPIPQFRWVIGTGAYLFEENNALLEQEQLLRAKMQSTIINMLAVSLIIMLLVMGIMFFISTKLRSVLSRYENHLLLSNKQIREQKLVFETLYQKSADGIWLLKEGIFVDCNEAIIRMFKASDKKELINVTLSDLSPEFQPDDQSSYEKALWMNALASQQGVHKFEWQARACDGALFWISVMMTTIRMDKGIIQHCSVRDITMRKELEEENKKQKKLLIHQVEHDTLTGLPNRNLLQDRLTQSIKKASRDNKVLGVMFVDVDKFKSVNDSLGHDAGDMLLKTIAGRMQNSVRETDTVARLSGDEFIVLLDGCKDVSDIFIAIKKLVNAFQEPFCLGNESFKITMSIGVSVYPNDGETASKLLKNADIAMYKAKSKGRNRYVFFDQEMNEETNEHLEVEKSLNKALANDEFVIFYQPQINLQTDKIVGFEALIRWNHPTRGLTAPGYFIHIAEESELIVEIGNWVIKEVMRQIKAWYDMGLDPGKTAINIAGKQLESAGLVAFMIQSLRESGCKPEWIEMEIVERFIMKDTSKSIALLKRFRELGVDISIDDFGTGHSSLAYLKQLPITKLKIDQSFVQNLEESGADRAIARTIIELGRGLGLKVLAEGVETKGQKEFIYSSGCELMQGYLFSKPIPAHDVELLLKNQAHML
ncbi:cache domain-containing protein [Sulfurospirillum halorespirans]|uniref:Diguanylate cyclase/phosphodiesterase (GGDEF & EAL domains) with PAS/PAC sensor(S) n=1 Tax=Sulfurospirillum halorespirans DSM 13726 TaxID=1193502 RepID=A0A1D7TNY0_9BACT|nr:cache domain-containing protein [Sulfurospirillum halorespirans]AOO66693.1 diguanylate cyclase/phosphodiesterase (GGDEF & EAL domains) with PAS/PAC sensor(s) [Sulfurospirillum halorespirans DSM 13726]